MFKASIDIVLLIISLSYILYALIGYEKKVRPENYQTMTIEEQVRIKVYNHKKIVHNLTLILSFATIDGIRYYFFEHSLSLLLYNALAFVGDLIL